MNPVTAETDLLFHEPFGGAFERRMIFPKPGFVQANSDDGGVPNRREARFDAHVVVSLVFEFLEFAFGADDFRMIVGIAERLECDERVEHRRENRGQSVRTFEAFEHPAFGVFERAFAKGVDVVLGEPFGEFVEAIQPEEKVAPGKIVRVGREGEVAFVVAFGIKFVQIHVHRARGLEMVDDGQWHEHGARPVAHLPEIYMKPFANEHHLARDGRDIFPRKEADQRQIQFGKGVHARHAAEGQRHFTGTQHAPVGDAHAGEFEGEIGLDGGVHFRRSAVVDVPAAVRQLHGKDVVDGLTLPFLVHLAGPVMIDHRVGHERGIHHQLAHPMTFRTLQAEQIFLRPQNGGFQISSQTSLEPGSRRRLCGLNPWTTFNHKHTLRICARTVKFLVPGRRRQRNKS